MARVTPEEEALSGRLIGGAIEVHRALGPGFFESVYHRALGLEFIRRGIRCESQVEVQVRYSGAVVGQHRLDFLVEPGLVLEIKAVHSLDRVHFAQLRSYLKATQLPVGLLINFGEPRLVVRRVIVRAPLPTSGAASPIPPTLPRLSD